ncbi:hypothetical protein [Streptomyces hoynatensis]|uniref:Uncharacterized protein n=1 Tax=Streptomyces hoynatensis TaxID=1141874 RepID=A0A3A9ZHG1_9ACTN|nr:hypothetical protein [Streptomyces hoynatensis]RKN47134.1 hypothetical protein D7294_02880 [Streptomyces hoynatensis]
MSGDGAGGGEGQARADLSVHSGELIPIAQDAAALARVETTGRQAGDTSYAAARDLRAAGLLSGDALHHAMYRFDQQSLHLSRDCTHIADELGTTLTRNAALDGDLAGRLRQAHAAAYANEPERLAAWGLTPADLRRDEDRSPSGAPALNPGIAEA